MALTLTYFDVFFRTWLIQTGKMDEALNGTVPTSVIATEYARALIWNAPSSKNLEAFVEMFKDAGYTREFEPDATDGRIVGILTVALQERYERILEFFLERERAS